LPWHVTCIHKCARRQTEKRWACEAASCLVMLLARHGHNGAARVADRFLAVPLLLGQPFVADAHFRARCVCARAGGIRPAGATFASRHHRRVFAPRAATACSAKGSDEQGDENATTIHGARVGANVGPRPCPDKTSRRVPCVVACCATRVGRGASAADGTELRARPKRGSNDEAAMS
jgi:hypothetical protein